MPDVIVARIFPAQGRTQDVLDLFTRYAPAVRAFDACELLAVHRDADDVVVIEKWASPDATSQPDVRAAVGEIASRLSDLVRAPHDVRHVTPEPDGPKSAL